MFNHHNFCFYIFLRKKSSNLKFNAIIERTDNYHQSERGGNCLFCAHEKNFELKFVTLKMTLSPYNDRTMKLIINS